MKAKAWVFTKKTAWMQRVADLVRTGHHFYVDGLVRPDRAQALFEKFDSLYSVNLTAVQASRARSRGEASARLLMLATETADEITWILLRTDGRLSPAAQSARESWKNALNPKQRIEAPGGYELVRLTKRYHPHPVWTWRYAREQYSGHRDAIRAAIRHRRDDQLRQLIYSLWRTPGFAGAREQVKQLEKLIRAEWKRSRRASEPMPEIPRHLGYVRRLSDKGVTLDKLMKLRMR